MGAGREHLNYLDGIRGLAALYVVAFHVRAAAIHYGPAPSWCPLGWAAGGSEAVAAFIVLSGFVLGLPVARGVPFSTRRFARHRCRRILPAYFAAMIAAGLVIYFAPALFAPALYGGHTYPWSLRRTLVTHPTLTQSFVPGQGVAVIAPAWSLSVEWAIYALFALLLVPVRSRFGPAAAVVVAVTTAAALTLSLPALYWSSFWFVACFGFGLAAAEWYVRGGRGPWLPVAVVLWVAAVVATATEPNTAHPRGPLPDTLTGAAVAASILALARGPSLLRRALESRPLAWLGGISYSLYLTHSPLLIVADSSCVRAGLSTSVRVALLLLAVPICVLFAAGWSRLFERPFMRR
jgi:peptidoglycan/LPS O-acetylase OafA/YrhL